MVRVAALSQADWVECTDRYLPTLAVVLPRELAFGFARHADQLSISEPDDNALLGYLRQQRPQEVQTLVAVRGAVEHLDDLSLAGNHTHGLRRSACYIEDPPEELEQQGFRVLPAPRRVPHFDWNERRAVYWVVERDVSAKWQSRPLLPLLVELGFTATLRDQIWEEARARIPLAMRQSIPEEQLRGLLDTAVSLGMMSQLSTDFTTTARVALRTMTPGALRLSTDLSLLTDHQFAMEACIAAAVQRAAELCRSGRLRTFSTGQAAAK